MVAVSQMKLAEAPVASSESSSTSELDFAYSTDLGTMYRGTAESFLESARAKIYRKKVSLIFTSPPFPLQKKKKYGNLQGDEYLKWIAAFAPKFKELLTPNGSIVMEVGNAWEPGKPFMSTLALKALIALQEQGELNLCQQFICYNPARLPSPAEWVNVQRIRVKDAFTHVWWMSPGEPTPSNKRVLTPYSGAMKKLLETKKYNHGTRHSEHWIGEKSFLKDNGGSIPSNVLTFANTNSNDAYLRYCRDQKLKPHPARMPDGLPDFFIRFLTRRNGLVLDPFGGSNTTGASAQRLKRRWISIEPTHDYIEASRGRFDPVPKMSLAPPPPTPKRKGRSGLKSSGPERTAA